MQGTIRSSRRRSRCHSSCLLSYIVPGSKAKVDLCCAPEVMVCCSPWLQILQEKAENRNPDEYYSAMQGGKQHGRDSKAV